MKAKTLVVVLLLAVLLLSGSACDGGEAPTSTPTPTSELSAEQIMEAVAEAEIETYRFDMYMSMTMVGEMPGTVTMDVTGAIDEQNREMYMDMQLSMSMPEPMETGMEIYIVGDWIYMGVEMPGEPAMWMKMTMTEYMWEELDITSQQLDLLMDFVEVELLGTETVGGVECYKLRVTPDMGKLWEWAQMQGGMEELDPALDLEDIISDFSITEWVAKDTYFTTKAVIDITMTIESDTIDMTMTMLMYGFNEPVSIELPPEAADAVEVPMP
ncbi:MAG: hypothetical protein E3J65_00905 [Dehalococcoidia bacterium]|nr:MAG: hypothetical protein E3J65_00905 [Dehalococcoidia bacterium]